MGSTPESGEAHRDLEILGAVIEAGPPRQELPCWMWQDKMGKGGGDSDRARKEPSLGQ